MIARDARIRIDYNRPGAARPREQRWSGRTGTARMRNPDGSWSVLLDATSWDGEREVSVSESCLVEMPPNLRIYPERPIEPGPVVFAPCALGADK